MWSSSKAASSRASEEAGTSHTGQGEATAGNVVTEEPVPWASPKERKPSVPLEIVPGFINIPRLEFQRSPKELGA